MPDESEIDEWFAQRVEFERSRSRFEKDFRALLAEYDSRFRAAAASQARSERIAKPLRRFAAWRHERAVAFALWRKRAAENYKRWRFERKYQKLFHKM